MSDESTIPKFRKTHLFSMAAKMALRQGQKYLQNNPDSKLSTLVDQANILVNHVGQLKGAAMKAVQSLAIEGQDFLPPEVIKILEKLQSQAPPVSSEVLKKHMADELGEERFALLEDLSEKPIASASIGQVYQAKYKGQPVVVKVQYPGVAESVDADIDTLKSLLKTLITVSYRHVNIDGLMEEARRVLKLETDYLNEMKCLQRYDELFKDTDFIIPQTYPEMTTSKVLLMSMEQGMELGEWIQSQPNVERRHQLALKLLDLYIRELYHNHLVQTDPNPANFLIDSEDRLVLLDFGATVEYTEDFVQDFRSLAKAVFSRQREDILQQVYNMDLLDKRESAEAREAFIDFLLLSMEPFEKKNQPFDFSDTEYSTSVRDQAIHFSRLLKYSAPPKTLIFLNRKIGGIFNIIKKMKVAVDLTETRQRILGESSEP